MFLLWSTFFMLHYYVTRFIIVIFTNRGSISESHGIHVLLLVSVQSVCIFLTRLCRIITAISLSNVFVKHMASHFYLDTISCGGLVTSLGVKLVLSVYAYVWRIFFLFTYISMIIFISRYTSDIWSKQARKYHNYILSSDSN